MLTTRCVAPQVESAQWELKLQKDSAATTMAEVTGMSVGAAEYVRVETENAELKAKVTWVPLLCTVVLWCSIHCLNVKHHSWFTWVVAIQSAK